MIKAILQEGFVLKSKGYYKHAIEAFYKALEFDNTSAELLLEIAELYYLLNDEERALNYIESILEKNPTHIETLKLLKNIFINKQAWAEAIQTSKNIYSISQTSENLTEIFKLLNRQGNFQEIFEYETIEETEDMLYEKAFAKFLLNELSEAIEYINKALLLKTNNKNLLLKGKILYRMKNKDECLQILKDLDLSIEDAELMNFIGLLEQYKCNFKKAIEYFLKAVKLDPTNDEYYYNCASTYFKLGDILQAKRYYNLAISYNPENPNYHFALANLYYSEKHYKRALEELDYDLFEAKLLKSIILYDSGYLAIAKKEMEKLIVEQPDNELLKKYLERVEENLKI
ncbi:tetratricopeptide repeat protein [bacterium]|nr:tetratricopeptide repeat protein [bacterium]